MNIHFKGKSVAEHLKDARLRGVLATTEIHNGELPVHLGALADGAKTLSLGLLILWSGLQALTLPLSPLLWLFAIGWIIWITGRKALQGWAKLERLHRLIEEERWEIQHHREQEGEELKELYSAKGFSGKLLDEVVEVLMADDNRLLQVMLEEELGLSLEVYEHPLKQAFGAFIGAAVATLLLFATWALFPPILPIVALLILSGTAFLSARFEKRSHLTAFVWNLALALFASGGVYLLGKLLAT